MSCLVWHTVADVRKSTNYILVAEMNGRHHFSLYIMTSPCAYISV